MINAKIRYVTILVALLCAARDGLAQTTRVQYLSGTGNDDTVEWAFMVDGGRRSGEWTTIPMPSNWEMQGFGTHRYYDDFSGGDERAPVPDSVGHYRYRFSVPAEWQDDRIDIVFGGSMTDTEVKVNGQLAGPTHQGGFYEFRYDVTELLKVGGENLLEVRVRKFSADSSINRAERQADYWLFGGIFRPVWLEAKPPQHIERIAINARHTGEIAIDVYLGGITSAGRVTTQVARLDGQPVGRTFSATVEPGHARVRLQAQVQGIQPWSAEWPHRYRLRLRLEQGGQTRHEVTETFGFRTVEVRPKDGFYINGRKVRLRGVNRHSIWPESGRTTSRSLSIRDAQLIKDMNMNAVRMSHYPPDEHFLEVADSLGLYVIDELAGWQAAYDTEPGRKLVRSLVTRDVNHPSVILWANGNEGGNNHDLVTEYARWDPQKRTVIHPWNNFGGINTSHYETYDCCAGSFFHGDDLFMPTEFLHGLYDGGHGAGLDDWWKLMVRNPLAVGGFLWAFVDEGIVRQDMEGMIDVAGNAAPDGILGPFREKEGSFFTIKEVWSPVYIEWSEQARLPPTFDGTLRIENRYDFTNLNQVRFAWRLVDFPGPTSPDTHHTIAARGMAASPDVPPRGVGSLSIGLPRDWRRHDALFLTATDAHDRDIYTWTWMITDAVAMAERVVPTGSGRATGTLNDGAITLCANGTEVRVDAATGRLQGVSRSGAPISLANGPRLASGEARLEGIRHYADGDDYVVDATFEGNLRHVRWRMLPSGWLRLDYAYHFESDEEQDHLGVSFDYPEGEVRGVRWLGRGPYRVWKNRLEGVEFGVWSKEYDDVMTGLSWEYPEFKGFHANTYWAAVETAQGPITLVLASDDLYLRLFTPAQPDEPEFDPRTTRVPFPPGDVSLLHGIVPIGTKFHPASSHGPAGQPNRVPRHGRTYTGTVFFDFGS